MSVVKMEIGRLLAGAERVCHSRNTSLPVALGKSLFEPCLNGAVFSKAHYLLDSSHCDYTNEVAKVVFEEANQIWLLFMPMDKGQVDLKWGPYPFLPQCHDIDIILQEIEKDPHAYFWG
ncbi:DUF3024 domain-containing protein [Vibrio kagoshimensis]|uniref:DUF3024 domain-containing protein n=1 Tax=Vibrio kagoshimensis TaxID=2910244 RepID=UPI0023534D1D